MPAGNARLAENLCPAPERAARELGLSANVWPGCRASVGSAARPPKAKRLDATFALTGVARCGTWRMSPCIRLFRPDLAKRAMPVHPLIIQQLAAAAAFIWSEHGELRGCRTDTE